MNHTIGAGPPSAGRWLRLARWGWLVFAVIAIGFWLLGSYVLLFRPLPDCNALVCDNLEFSAADPAIMQELGLSPEPIIALLVTIHVSYSLLFFVVAGLLFWRKSDDPIALLLSFSLIYIGAVLFTSSDDAVRRTFAAAGPPLMVIDILGLLAALLVFYLFPNGRFAPGWSWIPAVLLFTLVLSVPLVSSSSTRLRGTTVSPLAELLWLAGFAIMLSFGLASQVYRYKRVSSPIEKLQTRWVLFGLTGPILVVALWSFIGYAYPPNLPSPARIVFVTAGLLAVIALSGLLPVSVAFSILRYRLFAIDNLINRTLVYTLLTGSLAAIYLVVVVLLQRVFPASSQIATVLSTLLIAALFSPLRRRFQAAIDRRFYRHKYDLEKTVAVFGAAVRHEVGLQRLAEDLSAVVADTFEPDHVSLWLREAKTAPEKMAAPGRMT